MMISNIELPNECPKACPYTDTIFNSACVRCPVFNCGDEPLMRPERYNKNWAQEFKDWFDSGCSPEKYPKLEFKVTAQEECRMFVSEFKEEVNDEHEKTMSGNKQDKPKEE